MRRCLLHLEAKLEPLHVFIDDKFLCEVGIRAVKKSSLGRKFKISREITANLTQKFQKSIPVAKNDAIQKCAILAKIMENGRNLSASTFLSGYIPSCDLDRSIFAISTLQKACEARGFQDAKNGPKALQEAIYHNEQIAMCDRILLDIDFANFLSCAEKETFLSKKTKGGLTQFMKSLIQYKGNSKNTERSRNKGKRMQINALVKTPSELNEHAYAIRYPHLSEPALRQKLRLMQLRNKEKSCCR